jgi:hypothetical protein
VIEGYVSLESAFNDYKVYIDPERMEIDWEKTKKMRQEEG